jgi:small subunit ribosomal protein S6
MIMNQYELIYVTKPQLNATDLEGVNNKVAGLVEKASGQVLAFEDWGRRRLAYPIAKNEHGVYSYLNFVAPAAAPVGIEKAMGMDDSFMRYMTVQLGNGVDVESCRVDAEAKKAERDAVRAADEETARLAAEAEAEEVAAAAAARAARVAAAEADAAAAASAAPSEEAAEEVAEEAAEEAAEEVAEEAAEEAAEEVAEEAAKDAE